jgi:UDP-glucose 4-epimerase
MILVVGGAGYIGSHMCLRLRQLGVEHVVFDSLEKGHEKAVHGSHLHCGDLRRPQDIRSVFRAYPITAVLHFAAYIEVGESVKEPARYWENNVVGTFNLLEVMRKAGCQKLIFSSTAAIYGEPQTPSLKEDHPKNPASPYGATKHAVETMLDAYDAAYDFRTVCLRYFNASGADPKGAIGEDHRPETHLIPRVLLAAAGKADEVAIFGQDYPTPDGTCVRDYIHVLDLAEAHWLAVQHLLADGDSRRYNLGYGHGTSVREIIETVKKVTGKDFTVTEKDRRPGDPATLVADSSAIKNDWKWEPKRDDLEQIVADAWRFMQKHAKGYPD